MTLLPSFSSSPCPIQTNPVQTGTPWQWSAPSSHRLSSSSESTTTVSTLKLSPFSSLGCRGGGEGGGGGGRRRSVVVGSTHSQILDFFGVALIGFWFCSALEVLSGKRIDFCAGYGGGGGECRGVADADGGCGGAEGGGIAAGCEGAGGFAVQVESVCQGVFPGLVPRRWPSDAAGGCRRCSR